MHRRYVLLALSCLTLGLLASPTSTVAAESAGACTGTHWVASWTAAPTDGLAGVPPLQQTYRIKVVPHRGGTSARITLSNKFGLGPVTFGAATLGIQQSGPAIRVGSLRHITFGGADQVKVAKGGSVTSDPVNLSFAAFQDLLVSLFVVGAPGPATQHVLSGQTTWQSVPLSGDATENLAGKGFIGLPLPGLIPAIPQGIPYLSGFDVAASANAGTVVAFGDSITDGFQGLAVPLLPVASNVDLDARYPDRLAHRVIDAGLPLSVVNAGISGNQLLADAAVPIFGPSGLHRLETDGLNQPGTTTMILMEGINDLGQSQAKPAKLIAGYAEAITKAHARGISVLLGTLTPDEGALQPGYGFLAEASRIAVNDWIRSQALSDGIVDFDKAVRDPSHPTRILPKYDGGDHLHFSPAGYQAMADAVPLGALRGVCG